MTLDPRPDRGVEREAYYPFQQGCVPHGSPTPYVIGGLLLAILAVMGLNIVSVDDGDMLAQNKPITTASRPAAGNSASFN